MVRLNTLTLLLALLTTSARASGSDEKLSDSGLWVEHDQMRKEPMDWSFLGEKYSSGSPKNQTPPGSPKPTGSEGPAEYGRIQVLLGQFTTELEKLLPEIQSQKESNLVVNGKGPFDIVIENRQNTLLQANIWKPWLAAVVMGAGISSILLRSDAFSGNTLKTLLGLTTGFGAGGLSFKYLRNYYRSMYTSERVMQDTAMAIGKQAMGNAYIALHRHGSITQTQQDAYRAVIDEHAGDPKLVSKYLDGPLIRQEKKNKFNTEFTGFLAQNGPQASLAILAPFHAIMQSETRKSV